MARVLKPPDGYDADAILPSDHASTEGVSSKPWWLMPCGCDRRDSLWYRQGIPHPCWTPYYEVPGPLPGSSAR
jgi:hypothetical protein